METIDKTITLRLEVRECPECYIRYGVPGGFTDSRRSDHREFYCPNGHVRYYPQDNAEEALRKKLHAATLEKERAERVARESAEAAAKATGELWRMKVRAKAGVCPCCNRTFQQLARHMHSKHPDFKS